MFNCLSKHLRFHQNSTLSYFQLSSQCLDVLMKYCLWCLIYYISHVSWCLLQFENNKLGSPSLFLSCKHIKPKLRVFKTSCIVAVVTYMNCAMKLTPLMVVWYQDCAISIDTEWLYGPIITNNLECVGNHFEPPLRLIMVKNCSHFKFSVTYWLIVGWQES